MQLEQLQVKFYAGSDVRVEVNIVGSQDTTGLMTSQELESMAATVISPIVDGATNQVVILLQFGIISLRQIFLD
jgi:aconitase B